MCFGKISVVGLGRSGELSCCCNYIGKIRWRFKETVVSIAESWRDLVDVSFIFRLVRRRFFFFVFFCWCEEKVMIKYWWVLGLDYIVGGCVFWVERVGVVGLCKGFFFVLVGIWSVCFLFVFGVCVVCDSYLNRFFSCNLLFFDRSLLYFCLGFWLY